jgi:hypothetical protein
MTRSRRTLRKPTTSSALALRFKRRDGSNDQGRTNALPNLPKSPGLNSPRLDDSESIWPPGVQELWQNLIDNHLFVRGGDPQARMTATASAINPEFGSKPIHQLERKGGEQNRTVAWVVSQIHTHEERNNDTLPHATTAAHSEKTVLAIDQAKPQERNIDLHSLRKAVNGKAIQHRQGYTSRSLFGPRPARRSARLLNKRFEDEAATNDSAQVSKKA